MQTFNQGESLRNCTWKGFGNRGVVVVFEEVGGLVIDLSLNPFP